MPVVINPQVISNGTVFPGPDQAISGGVDFLLLGTMLLVIALVFRAGIKNQTENESTV